MEQLVKGSKAPRVKAVCTKCGVEFERSAVHPYIVDCPDCRGSIRSGTIQEREFKKRVKCPSCREMIAKDGGLGMRQCRRCGNQWWSMPGVFWRNWLTDETFKDGKYVGTMRESSFSELYSKAFDHA